MDCYDVAGEIGYSVDDTSSVLSDINRVDYVERRSTESNRDVQYEYQLKSNVRVE
jgi:hypothetical protein